MSDSRPATPRRERTASESLLSIALALESVLVFFVALTAFGLRALEPLPAFIGGAALIVALVLTARLVRYRWGVGLGCVLQAVLLATGILLPIMYVVAAGFIAIWIFCFVKGRQLDAAKAAFLAANPNPSTPTKEQ
ncbi:MAG: DUF4233 domain-containing protein [Rhodoglobus sp.]